MAVINRFAGFADEMAAWRRALHGRPELGLACHETAGFEVERLREFGITRIEEGIAESGVVAVIEGQGDGPAIGLRADMDALPINEASGAEYASEVAGSMHACGHDGHTTMLMGAAKYFDAPVRRVISQRLEKIVAGQAASYGVEAVLRCEEGYAPMVNDASKAAFAAEVAREVAVDVVDDMDRQIGSEDFAAMLEARPGAYLFLGQGPGAGLHHPEFDFNDRIAPVAASFYARLVERAQPVG